jgi:hypothetical protein
MSSLEHKLICVTCGNEFLGKKIDSKNCSKECRNKAKNMKRKQVNDAKLTERLIPKPCKVCGEMFIPNKLKIEIQVYCGKVCQQKDMHILRTQKPGYHDQRAAYKRKWWKVNTEEKREKNNFYSYRNRYDGNYIPALERDNYACTVCGETNRSLLHVHHKDHSGKTKNPNHSLDNLVTLCNSCHMKHHQSEEYNIHKKRIPPEEVAYIIECSTTLREAAKKLSVSEEWIYTWHSKNWEILKPVMCPVCKKEFQRRKFRNYCSMKCVRKGNENSRMFPTKE